MTAQLDLFRDQHVPSYGAEFTKRRDLDDPEVRGMMATLNETRDRMMQSPEFKALQDKWAREAEAKAAERTLPQTGAELLAQARYCCTECGRDGPADCACYIDGSAYCPTCESKLCTVETLMWGKKGALASAKFWELRLVRRAAEWSVDGDYAMPNQGGYSGLGNRTFPSRDEALIAALRAQLGRVAKHLAVYRDGDSMYGKAADWRGLASWCIQQSPPPLMGGPDLEAEYAEMRQTYTAREELRCAAIRADKTNYTGEDGRERSIYSL